MPWLSYLKESVNSKTFFSHRRVFLVFFDLQLCFISQGSCSTNLTRLDACGKQRKTGTSQFVRVDLRVANLYEQPPLPFVQKETCTCFKNRQFFSSDLIEEFLCFHNIPATVWNTVNDSDSYARASALLVTGSLVCRSKLWISLLQNSQLSEVFSGFNTQRYLSGENETAGSKISFSFIFLIC